MSGALADPTPTLNEVAAAWGVIRAYCTPDGAWPFAMLTRGEGMLADQIKGIVVAAQHATRAGSGHEVSWALEGAETLLDLQTMIERVGA